MSCAPVAPQTTTSRAGAIGRICSTPANTLCTTRSAGQRREQSRRAGASARCRARRTRRPAAGSDDELDLGGKLAELAPQRTFRDQDAHARESNVTDPRPVRLARGACSAERRATAAGRRPPARGTNRSPAHATRWRPRRARRALRRRRRRRPRCGDAGLGELRDRRRPGSHEHVDRRAERRRRRGGCRRAR